jgi:hypothetical protein
VFGLWDRQVLGIKAPEVGERPLTIRRASLRMGHEIAPRSWLYGSALVRRYITVMVAPGGVGKTAWSVAVGLSLAHGRGLIGDWVHEQANTLVCCLEDPEDEFDRRIAAGMMRHRLRPADLAGSVYHINGRDRRLTIAAIGEDGMSVAYPDKAALIEQIQALEIGCVIVDPFVNSHELEENSNPHINAAARAWAEIAEQANCAVLLIHHTRKGATAGDIDAARGASALIGAARAGFTLTAMTAEEAREFGVPEEERRRHVRLDDAKANLAPPSEKARWFRLDSVQLGNATELYPKGDSVQAIVAWEPPSIWQDLTPSAINAALDAISAGIGGGRRYTASRAGKGGGERWAGRVLTRDHGLNDDQAAKVIATWVRTGLLVEDSYLDPQTRKSVSCVRIDHTKRPSA